MMHVETAVARLLQPEHHAAICAVEVSVCLGRMGASSRYVHSAEVAAEAINWSTLARALYEQGPVEFMQAVLCP